MSKITHPSQVQGFTRPPAGEVLRKAARKIPPGMCAVEIGVYFGRSLLYLALGSDEGNLVPVHGIDPWDLPGERYPFAWRQEKAHRSLFTLATTRESAEASVAGSPWADLVKLHRAFSTELAASWDGPKVAVLHVDGLHTEEGVRGDFEAWAPHLADGAAIFWDDYVPACQPVIDVTNALHAEGRLTRPKLAPGCRRLAACRYTPKGVTQ